MQKLTLGPEKGLRGSEARERNGEKTGSVLLYSESSVVSDDLPTQAPYSVLWARHQIQIT